MTPSPFAGTLAAAVVVAHFGFLLFVALGALLTLRWRRAPWIHVPAAMWGAWIELTGGVCPLTPLENRLRRAAGGVEYPGSFIEHYVLRILYPAGLTRELQLALGVAALALNVALYVWIARRLSGGSPGTR
jgi:hypothetical protein